MTTESTTFSSRHPLDNRIPPPFVTILVGAGMWTATLIEPAIQFSKTARLLSSMAVFSLGLTALALGFRAFRKSQTTIDPVQLHLASALVTHGIFRHTRNPMYVGFTALLIAWAVFLAVPLALIGPVLFVLFTTRFQILPEEKMMESKFGQLYNDYRRDVRRWI